ncbi:MAG: type II toxin-antitoxin system prevent-host-death family antitoxin [Gemmatimonadota bacterium]
MHAVGIRELKNRLSHYVRLVEAGEAILVTDRGNVVAELRPPGRGEALTADPVEMRVMELARRGRAVVGAPHEPALYGPRREVLGGAAAELLRAERGER